MFKSIILTVALLIPSIAQAECCCHYRCQREIHYHYYCPKPEPNPQPFVGFNLIGMTRFRGNGYHTQLDEILVARFTTVDKLHSYIEKYKPDEHGVFPKESVLHGMMGFRIVQVGKPIPTNPI